MTSPYERPNRVAAASLRDLVTAAGEELAAWRRRALRAEADLQELAAKGPASEPAREAASPELVAEVAELRRRLTGAREQVDLLRTRLRFLEERSDGAA
jgi:hypothetical protein